MNKVMRDQDRIFEFIVADTIVDRGRNTQERGMLLIEPIGVPVIDLTLQLLW